MDFTPSLNAKGFFRFTGPPENWLTAIKYMTWGLELKHKARWEEIQQGDIFFIHSTKKSSFKNTQSGIVGYGVVDSNFSTKQHKLWLQEIKENKNKWPLLVPFSAIYLFGKLPAQETWQSPNLLNQDKTQELIDVMLQNYIPLSQVKKFPHMGSFSAVSKDVAKQILSEKKSLYEYTTQTEKIIDTVYAPKLKKPLTVKDASEALRYAGTLKVFDEFKTRIVRENKSQYVKDNALLAKAQTAHDDTLEKLKMLFEKNGYEVKRNKFLDLFAHKDSRAFLCEVKSNENNNFRDQAKGGLAQLLEYDFFEIKRFTEENKLQFKEKYKLLITSQMPQDLGYVKFLNSLQIGVAIIDNNTLKLIGEDFGFTKI